MRTRRTLSSYNATSTKTNWLSTTAKELPFPIFDHISKNQSRNYLVYTFNAETTHEMLIALRQRVAPTDEARELELIGRYNKLKKPPRSQDLESWFQQWEKTYKEAKALSLAEVKGKRPPCTTSSKQYQPLYQNSTAIG